MGRFPIMPTIAIFAPMQEELDALLRLLPHAAPKKLPGLDILETTFHGNRLILAKSGVGKVNTAMNVAIVLAHTAVDAVLNVGTAGGLRQGQKILDLVVPEEVLAVDVDVTPLGFAYGQILGGPPVFFTDPNLRGRFERAATRWTDMPTVHRGAVGTGDTFVNKPQQVELIRERFGRDRVACVEMEGAALAQVCLNFAVPCLIVRSLSDVPADGEENHLDFPVFLERAAHNAARLLVEMLEEA